MHSSAMALEARASSDGNTDVGKASRRAKEQYGLAVRQKAPEGHQNDAPSDVRLLDPVRSTMRDAFMN